MKKETRYKNGYRRLSVATVTTLATLLIGSTAAQADDTEIFTAYTPGTANSNVVFILDTSGSMGHAPSGATDNTTKIQIVKNVFEKLIFDVDANGNPDHTKVNPKINGLNIALMRFDQDNAHGGYFLTAMKKLNNGNFKSQLWTAVNGLQADGSTPLAETAYEAALYFQGSAPVFGDSSTPGTNANGITAGNNYKSPFNDIQAMQSQCSINNHLVILTDGKPTSDGEADADIQNLPHAGSCGFESNNYTADCLPMVAKYLYNEDFVDNEIDGIQNVHTHTIAFDLQEDDAVELLRMTAEDYGGGVAANANNASELADAIGDIITNVIDSATTFVSPAVSVSSSNRFVHDNTVYFSLFKPEVTPRWDGNLKGYQVSADGVLMDFSDPPINALDDSGEISPLAKSKWSDPADGNDVPSGGAAAQILAQASRNIVTQDSSDPNNSTLVDFNALNVANADLGAANDTEKNAIINWAVSSDTNPIADPLHSEPQVVNYGGSTGSIIFFGTNRGFLHAVSTESGEEKFAFIPKALLSNLKTLKDNKQSDDHPYGLDGPVTVYKDDSRVLVIVGMRRGGNSYYALDVTDPDNPTLQWQITGGTGDFAALGDTWAKPIVTTLNFGNFLSPTQKKVVLFTGGYDTQYDDLSVTPSSPKGNAIYAVNLLTGALEWSAGSGSSSPTATHLSIPELNDAIPSEVSAIDVNSDGAADRLYVIDLIGRIFRIDFNNTVSSTTGTSTTTTYLPSGRLFANLSGNNRRFYYSVDVAYTRSGFTPALHLSVGSGLRPNPLNETSVDSFFSVLDISGKAALPTDFTPITVSDLTDTTTLPINSTIESGWYFTLPQSEKVLSAASSFGGYVFFTTYTPPDDPGVTVCTPPLGSGKLYAVKLGNSEALSSDRAIALQSIGIPPSPTFMTLDQPRVTSNPPIDEPNDPFVSTDTRRIVLVGGQNPLSDEDEDKLNQSDTSKTYWQLLN